MTAETVALTEVLAEPTPVTRADSYFVEDGYSVGNGHLVNSYPAETVLVVQAVQQYADVVLAAVQERQAETAPAHAVVARHSSALLVPAHVACLVGLAAVHRSEVEIDEQALLQEH